MLLQDVSECCSARCGVGPAEEVMFTQITATSYSYRDAVRFRNGCEILLQRLREGQRLMVCDLSSAEPKDDPVRESLVVRT